MAAYEFHIYFFGLICHVGAANKKYYAAMVRDPDHDPVVIYEPGGDNDCHKIDRDAVAVKFEIDDVISTADATTTAAFRRFVPSLEMLMGGSPRPGIEAYAIKAHYPDGNVTPLAVSKFYVPLGWYIRSGQTRRGPDCVAQLTGIDVTAPTANSKLNVVSFDAKGDKKYVNSPDKPFTVGECLVIANRPKHAGMATGHVRKYGKILIEEDSLVTVLQPGRCDEEPEKPPACDWLKYSLTPSANDVECGNTNWP